MHLLSLLQVEDLGIRYTERFFRLNAINGSEGPTFASQVTNAVLNGPKAEVGLFACLRKTHDWDSKLDHPRRSFTGAGRDTGCRIGCFSDKARHLAGFSDPYARSIKSLQKGRMGF